MHFRVGIRHLPSANAKDRSALSGRAVRRDVAMTGEVSLRGRVLAIGGLKEKTMAAYSYGVKTVLLPEDNMRLLDEIDKAAREGMEFVSCKTVSDVLAHALVSDDGAESKTEQNAKGFPHINTAHKEIASNNGL